MLEEIELRRVPVAMATGTRPVALICDLTEENWPSMDLIADMLIENLTLSHAADFMPARLRPTMRRRFTRIPISKAGPVLYNADRLINRFLDYPLWLRRQSAGFDLFHIIDHSYAHLVHALPAERTVVTCHDLDTFRCVLNPELEARPRWFRAMTRRILDGLRRAAHVIAVSSATRDEVIERGLVPPERVSVVHNGVHPSCSPIADSAADSEAARLLRADSAGAFWLLSVGSAIRRKRLDVLLRVLAAVRREIPSARLARVGAAITPEQWQLARELKIENAVFELPYLTRSVLAAVYRRADVLLHTADAEGFGLPLIEALACGCPVVASDLRVLREVGEGIVAYCPVADVETWKNTVVDLLRQKAQRSSAFDIRRKQAVAHAARFSWVENARRTAHIYQQVLHAKNIA